MTKSFDIFRNIPKNYLCAIRYLDREVITTVSEAQSILDNLIFAIMNGEIPDAEPFVLVTQNIPKLNHNDIKMLFTLHLN